MKADFKKWLKGRELKLMSEKFMLFTSTEHEELLNQFAEDFAKQENEPLIKMLYSLTNSMMAHPDYHDKGGEFDDYVNASIELLNKNKDES